MQFIHVPTMTQLHDDVVGYMWDTLSWIPTVIPPGPGDHGVGAQDTGLNRWGPTVITVDGALKARAIFGAWARLVSSGPARLTLRGPWTQEAGVTSKSGDYQRLEFDRDAVGLVLDRLESYAGEVERGGGDLYILHLGV